jgi:hypothetical protein
MFLLEDLDAAGFSRRVRRNPEPAALDRCLAWLAAFHARFLGVPPEGLWKSGTYWHLATRPDELAAIEDRDLREAAPILDARLRDARQVGVGRLASRHQLHAIAGRDDQRLTHARGLTQLAQQRGHGVRRQGDRLAHGDWRRMMRETDDDDHAAPPRTA